MIVFTPKGLLRDPRAVSTLDECARGSFQKIIAPDNPNAKRVLLCSGRIHYELETQRQKLKRDDIAVVRIEQLYPLTIEQLNEAFDQYEHVKEFFWVQEEPENMGASRYVRILIGEHLKGVPFRSISRPASPSPATGSPRVHKKEEKDILERALV